MAKLPGNTSAADLAFDPAPGDDDGARSARRRRALYSCQGLYFTVAQPLLGMANWNFLLPTAST